jgi:endonuclease-3
MLYAVCLENATQEHADAAYERLHSAFHDLNEIRVSTYYELTPVFAGLSDPDARAARIRAILQYVFEINFDFDFEPLKRKTLELAEKQLQKIRFVTHFIQAHTLHVALGTHMIPIDDHMRDAAVWLGLATPGSSTVEASDGLKAAILKSDAPVFCHYLRAFSTDPRLLPHYAKPKPPAEGFDVAEMLGRAEDLLVTVAKAAKAKPAKNTKSAASKPSAKRAAKKPAAKSTPAKKKPR